MELLKTYREGDWVVTHERYIDDFGLPRDVVTCANTLSNGDIKSYPVTPPVKAVHYNPGDDMWKHLVNDYTEEDLRDELHRLQNYLTQ